MLRALIYGLTILHLGPGFAFAVVAFGCDSDMSILTQVCQPNTFAAFVKLTLCAWGMMVTLLICKFAIEKRLQPK